MLKTRCQPQQQADIITIGLLDYDGAQKSALFGLADFFHTANILAGDLDAPCIKTIFIKPDTRLPGNLDALVCPPCLETEPPVVEPVLIDQIVSWHRKGAVICSVCAGAWIIASTGLLDGRHATTHWQLADRMQQAFPDVLFQPDQILIDDGDIMTGGGVMAWTDMGLRLVERFLGPSLMMQVARQFLVEPGHREQRYFSSFNYRLQHGNQSILMVQDLLRKNLTDHHDIDSLASAAGMTVRSFQRKFKQATGHTPVGYIQNLRVEKARRMLEFGTDSFTAITWKVGYDDSSAFQKLFMRIVGLGPREYRRRFGIAGANQHAETPPD